MTLEDFTICEKIGHGVFGTIFRVIEKKSKNHYVMKKIDLQGITKDDRKNIYQKREEDIHRSLTHENIALFKCSFRDENFLCLVMEYCRGGDLHQYIQRQVQCIEEKTFIRLVKEICDGLAYLHYKGILHRDLKPHNIFLTEMEKIKIGDLGVARIIEDTKCHSRLTKGIGTPYFMSPELRNGHQYNQKTDIWSLGCTCYEMLTREHAFQSETMNELITQVDGNVIPSKLKKVKYSDDIKQLIIEMIKKDPDKRPTTQEIRERLYRCEQTHFADSCTAETIYVRDCSGYVTQEEMTGSVESKSKTSTCSRTMTELESSDTTRRKPEGQRVRKLSSRSRSQSSDKMDFSMVSSVGSSALDIQMDSFNIVQKLLEKHLGKSDVKVVIIILGCGNETERSTRLRNYLGAEQYEKFQQLLNNMRGYMDTILKLTTGEASGEI